jgi:hypothetical protein
MPFQRKIWHRKLCAQHAFTQPVFTHRCGCPFLITYLSCTPSIPLSVSRWFFRDAWMYRASLFSSEKLGSSDARVKSQDDLVYKMYLWQYTISKYIYIWYITVYLVIGRVWDSSCYLYMCPSFVSLFVSTELVTSSMLWSLLATDLAHFCQKPRDRRMEIGWGKYFPHFLNTDGSKHRSTFCSIELLTFLPVETESRESNHFVDSGVRMVQVQNRTQGVRMPVKRCS